MSLHFALHDYGLPRRRSSVDWSGAAAETIRILSLVCALLIFVAFTFVPANDIIGDNIYAALLLLVGGFLCAGAGLADDWRRFTPRRIVSVLIAWSATAFAAWLILSAGLGIA